MPPAIRLREEQRTGARAPGRDRRLLQLHDRQRVPVRIDDPGHQREAQVRDPVDCLQTRHVVLLDLDTAGPQLGELGSQVEPRANGQPKSSDCPAPPSTTMSRPCARPISLKGDDHVFQKIKQDLKEKRQHRRQRAAQGDGRISRPGRPADPGGGKEPELRCSPLAQGPVSTTPSGPVCRSAGPRPELEAGLRLHNRAAPRLVPAMH